MNIITRPTVAVLFLLIALTTTSPAQQKRQTPAKPQPKPAAAPAPAPTFETLIPADSYTIYGEVRNAGNLIQSNAATEILEPILQLASPPQEFKAFVNWLNEHTDEVMSSRLLIATWPRSKDVPETIVAIEFSSPEEAMKFANPLNQMLKKVMPPVQEPATDPKTEKAKPDATPQPRFHLQQAGALVIVTPTPVTLKKLRPAGGKLLSEDNNFRTARNRFNSEPIFVYVDLKMMEEERRKQYEEAQKEAERLAKQSVAVEQETKKVEDLPEAETGKENTFVPEKHEEVVLGVASSADEKEAPIPDPVLTSLTTIGSSFFAGESNWPDAIGLALTFETDSFDVRALFVNSPGDKSDVVPFVPMLIPGPPFVPESPNVLPADTELFVTMSLDLAQIYSAMSKPRPNQSYMRRGILVTVNEPVPESPFAAIEKKLKMNLKDDVLPLLGSEIALRVPVIDFNFLGVGIVMPGGPMAAPETKESSEDQQAAARNGPAVVISLRDKEGMRALMPKLVDALGFQGASSFAKTERKEDTEIVSYLDYFSYAFVGNFLVLSANPATTRHIVDSYLKNETLAADSSFKNYTRWQPRPAQGQLYISPVLMQSYKTWIESPNTRLNDQTRAFLQRVASVAQPITYSLSNEGLGPLHELHVPKNLILMAVAGISNETNRNPVEAREHGALAVMYTILGAQETFKTDKGGGSYGTLDQLIAADMVSKEMIEKSGYKFEVTVVGDKFEVFGVPVEYGKTGIKSYYLDKTYILRGGDKNGALASSSDPPIR